MTPRVALRADAPILSRQVIVRLQRGRWMCRLLLRWFVTNDRPNARRGFDSRSARDTASAKFSARSLYQVVSAELIVAVCVTACTPETRRPPPSAPAVSSPVVPAAAHAPTSPALPLPSHVAQSPSPATAPDIPSATANGAIEADAARTQSVASQSSGTPVAASPRMPVAVVASPNTERPGTGRAAKSPPATVSAPPPAAPPVVATVSAKPPPSAALNLTSLEQRLRDTGAIGVFTKLSLKNQVDELLSGFRTFHGGHTPPTLASLRQRYDLLLLKVLTLLQDGDPPLASEVAASRDAIWGILADRDKFQRI